MESLQKLIDDGRPIKGCYVVTPASTGQFRGRVVGREGNRVRIDCTFSEKKLWHARELGVLVDAYLVKIDDWGTVYRSGGSTRGITGSGTMILTEADIRSQVRNTKEGVRKHFESKDGHTEQIRDIVADERAKCQTAT